MTEKGKVSIEYAKLIQIVEQLREKCSDELTVKSISDELFSLLYKASVRDFESHVVWYVLTEERLDGKDISEKQVFEFIEHILFGLDIDADVDLDQSTKIYRYNDLAKQELLLWDPAFLKCFNYVGFVKKFGEVLFFPPRRYKIGDEWVRIN